MAKMLYPEYVSLTEVKGAIDRSELKGDQDEWLTRMTNAVFLAAQAAMNRQLTSRRYKHNGVDLPRLSGSGTAVLFLENPPITTLTELKRWPDEGALTRGWDQEFTLNEQTGKITLVRGFVFPEYDEMVEVDYTGGFLADASALDEAQRSRFGWNEAAADIKQSIITQVADFAQRKARGQERLSSFTTDGGSFTISPGELLDDVRACWQRHRVGLLG